MQVPIISVTGTKGKTTTVAVIDDALRAMGYNTLRVDTKGHFVNGEQRSTLQDSNDVWQLVPTKAPGRYLWEFHNNPELSNDAVAVLECSLGCSRGCGLGYASHDVGIFLNVFEDHLGSADRLKSREDIAYAKKFVFENIQRHDAYAVFNADDELVVRMLNETNFGNKQVSLVPVGLTFSEYDIAPHLEAGGVVVTMDSNRSNVILRSKKEDQILACLDDIPWTFNGAFMPSVWNMMFACAGLYGVLKGNMPDSFRSSMESVRLDRYGGRLTVLKARNGATIIADYAHEKVSLESIGKLARTICDEGKVVAVVRMAHDRTDELLTETGKVIGKSFDTVVVYEKIDGFWRKPVNHGVIRFPQVVGRTSEKVYQGVRSVNEDSVRILREDEALQYAASIAAPEDVVVVIVNDDIKRSVEFIQTSFDAEFA